MPTQLVDSSSTSSTASNTDCGEPNGGRGGTVWQREGTSPIDRRSDGSESGRRDHTHAAGGAEFTSCMDVDGSLAPSHGKREVVPVRDSEFYIDHADCVIRVEDTLFRVSGAW